jgi:hypothetical protein
MAQGSVAESRGQNDRISHTPYAGPNSGSGFMTNLERASLPEADQVSTIERSSRESWKQALGPKDFALNRSTLMRLLIRIQRIVTVTIQLYDVERGTSRSPV